MKYFIPGILIFIGLALVARADILRKKEFWESSSIPDAPSSIRILQEGNVFWQSEAVTAVGYVQQSMIPYNKEALQHPLDSLAEYLKEHNEKMVILKSSYQDQEKTTQVAPFASLGIARSYWLSQELVQRGISRSRYELLDSLVSNNIINFIDIEITEEP